MKFLRCALATFFPFVFVPSLRRRVVSEALDLARQCVALVLVYAMVLATLPLPAVAITTAYSASLPRPIGLTDGPGSPLTLGPDTSADSARGRVARPQDDTPNGTQKGTLIAGLLPPSLGSLFATTAASVTPQVQCVVNKGGGSYVAWFGYLNSNSTTVSIPVGNSNGFSPTPQNRGQVTSFLAGQKSYAFNVPFNGSNLTWSLTGPDGKTHTVTASSASNKCVPTANAGSAQTVYVGATVQLDGTKSSDPVGLPLTYAWSFLSKPSGSSATLSSATASKPTFVADKSGTYCVQLVVNNGQANSTASTVSITSQYSTPVANAGSAQTVYVGATVHLDGTASYDPAGLPLTYSWSFFSKPTGSTATLSSATSSKPTFVADKPGSYVVQLSVSNGHNTCSAPSKVTITSQYSTPVANAGPPQTVYVGVTVQLDGTASYDPSGLPLSYAWSFVSGPTGSTATISNSTSSKPTFVADKAGSFVVQLSVSNGHNACGVTSKVTITSQYSTPVANAGPPQTVYVAATVTLNGTGSSDPAGAALTYQWSFLTKPTGSTAVLSSATAAKPTFVTDKAGTYKLQLIVNNGHNASAPATVVITSQSQPPVAVAGPAQTVFLTATVQLDGTGSYDPAGLPLTYLWSFVSVPAGSSAVLSSTSVPKPTFVVDKPGTYTVQLVVNNGVFSSAPSTVQISTQNSPPVANAGPNQTVKTHATVQLDGSASSDVDGDPLTYTWTLFSKPAGSTAVLSSTTIVNPTFVTDAKGNYVVQLIVNDGQVNSTPSTVTISTVNTAPVANAGPDQAITVTQTVQLDGSGSTDVDGDPLTYSWSFVTKANGSNAVLSNPNAVNPTFNADVLGTYVLQLVVNDGTANSVPSTVTITSGDVAPVANPGPAQSVALGSLVILDGTGSTDSNHQPLLYQWSLLSKPANSTASLSLPTSAHPYFTVDLAGNYVLQLIVNDGFLDSPPATVTISTINSVPVANPGPDQTVTAGATVQLTGAASTDADADPLTYKWAILTQPAGGTAVLSNATIVNPTFVANVAGTYVAQLIVNDGKVDSPPATVMITANTPNQAPVVNAGANQTITLPMNSVTLNGSATDDGLPNHTLTLVWNVVSGPAIVTFGNASNAVTTATFTVAGTYVLQLTANDSLLSTSATTTVTVNPAPANQAPVVSAGPNQTITLPTNAVTLNGTATDDGLPNGTLTITWSKVSGPAAVTFSSPNTAVTQATFSMAGTYVLQLTANDSQLSSSATVTVTVRTSGPNQAPVVSAGPNQTITFPTTTVTLNGSVTDDGLPNGTLTSAWTQVSGPGSVVFTNPAAAATQATFNAPGFYDLRLTATDSQLTSSSDVLVYVYTSGHGGQNQPPYVSAGPDQTVVIPATLQLNGVAVDDGLPNGTLAVSWTKVSGPGTVTFSNSTSAITSASFSIAGDYVLQLAANDSVLVSTSNVNITVGKLDGHMSNKGTDFWLLFPRNGANSDAGAGFQPQLIITSDTNTSGTVTIPGLSFSSNFTVSAGLSTIVQLPTTAAAEFLSDVVDRKGIHVTSQSEITVVGFSFSPYATDGYLALPTPVLGTDYVVPAYTQAFIGYYYPVYLGGSEVSIVAPQDGTTLTITPAITTMGRVAGQPYKVILNQGRTYQLMANDVQGDLTGTQITSDKPVAVFGGADCANIPYPYQGQLYKACNHIVEQIPPTDQWGTNFVVIPFVAQPKGSLIRVLAAQNGTNVSINGTPIATLNRGQFYDQITADPLSIVTDKPALVVQYMASLEFQSFQQTTLGDPSMQLIPSYEQFGGHYVVVTPNVPSNPATYYTGIPNHYLNIVVPTATANSVQLDGIGVDPALFSPIGSSTLSGAGIPTVPGTHHLSAASPLGVSLYGVGVADAYSYQAGMVFASARAGTTVALTPSTATQQTGTQFCAVASVVDPFGNLDGGIGVGFAVTGANPSNLYVDTDSAGHAQYCYVGANSGVDSIVASVGLASATSTLTWAAGAGNQAPAVYAGIVQQITLPNTATLAGVATDDGLPSGSTLSTTWSQISGPGTVSFANASQPVTVATFSAAGTYNLRLTATDSQLTATSDVTVVVAAAQANQAPTVNAGSDQTITMPIASVSLTGTTTDDGFPFPAKLATQWTEVSGPTGAATVVFSNSTGLVTQATFNKAGTYVLQLTADDSQLTASSTVTITVIAQNQTPVVNPGGPYQIALPTTSLTLNGTVTDDGLPVGSTVTSKWTQTSGPARVTFADPTQPTTQATFPVAGFYILTLTATDTQLTTSTPVYVTVNPLNQPPSVVINTTYQVITLPANTATLSATVTDDGQPNGTLTQIWTLQNGPAGVTFGTPTQATTTVTFTAAGNYYFTLTASDSQLIGSGTAVVTVDGGVVGTNPNQAPFVYLRNSPTLTPLPNATATLDVSATDDGLPNGTLVTTWSQVNGPALVTFATPNQPVTQATFPVAGSYQLRLTASDSQLTSSVDVYVQVSAVDQAPTVSLPTYATTTLPVNTVSLVGTASDPNGLPLTYSWSEIYGAGPVTFSAPNSLTTQATFQVAGTYFIQLTASNGALSSTATIIASVRPAAPGAPPQVSIALPEDGQEITKPVTVIGSVSGDPNGQVLYRLEYSLNSNDGSPQQTWLLINTNSSGLGISIGTLGTLDPTLMLDGSYTLRLTATDGYGQSSSATTTFTVTKNMKVGNFTLSFTDLTVPVSGLPITVTRTYDSRDHESHDFGVGWSLGIANVRLQKNRPLGKNWNESVTTQSGFTNYCLQSLGKSTVTITFPDGKLYKFQTVSLPQCQNFAPISAPTVGFVELPGSPGTEGATLAPADGGQVILDGAVPGDVNLTDYSLVTYNPTVFNLTTREGYTYVIDQKLGVTGLTDPNGNTLTITANGIVSSTGKSVTFVRDSLNRITQITDPAGHILKYEYNATDSTGALSAFTDGAGNQSRFYYDYTSYNGSRLLNTIYDPSNNPAIRSYYDFYGRLRSTIDANGNTINYNVDLTGQTETITDRLGNPTVYSYDADGNILSQTDAQGHTTTFTYDVADNKLTETNALGKTTRYTYDGASNLLSKTDPLGNKTTYTYDQRGQVLTVTDPQGHTTTNVYDLNGNLTSTTDANGKSTTTIIGANGLPSSITDAAGNVTQFGYDGSGNLLQETDALNNITNYTYDANNNKLTQVVTRTVNGSPQTLTTGYTYDADNRLTKTTYPDGTTTQVHYNPIGKQDITTDQLGRQTSYNYDTLGRLTTTTYPDTTTETATYDAENHRLTSTDRAGNTTTYTYDTVGRLSKTTYADTTFTITNYDNTGRVSSTVDANNNATTYGYDDAGRRTSVTDALNHVTTFTYDAAGNQATMLDANHNTTTYHYDTLNRQVGVTYPDNSTSATAYDSLGRVSSKTDQAGKVTSYGYDKLGRLTTVTQDAVAGGLNYVTGYGYDEIGERISQTDASNHTTTYSYDQNGRRIGRKLPLGQSESYVYDLAGNLRQKTDFNGKTTTYAYDTSNRLLSKTPDPSFGAAPVTFTYSANGLRKTMADPSGATTYTYDVRSRLRQKQTPAGTLNYTYDNAGDLLTLASANLNGASATYTYDTLNRLSTVADSTGTTTYAYDPVGNLAGYSYPNGVQTTYSYDTLNRLSQMGAAKGAALSTYTYTLGVAGNRKTVAELSGRTVQYGYDSLYRLNSETVTADPANHNGATTYTYDPVGNRQVLKINGVTVNTYNYDANDRLTSDVYDNDGNTTSSTGITNAYDFENHLVQHGGVSIVYDGDGNRVAETVGGVTTKYLVDTQNPTGYAQVVDELVGGAVTRTYTYGLERISENQQISSTWTPSFYGYDGHGSVRQLLNSTGVVTDTYDYDVFGNLVNSTGSTPNNYLFASEQFDPALGLYYNRARHLNTSTGRFWGMDTHEGDSESPLSLHKYLYAAADPVNHSDPSGHDLAEVSITLSISIGLGAVGGYVYSGTLKGAIAGGAAGGLFGLALLSRNPKFIADTVVNGFANAVFLKAGWWLGENYYNIPAPQPPQYQEKLLAAFAAGELNAVAGSYAEQLFSGSTAVGVSAAANALLTSYSQGQCWKDAIVPALTGFVIGSLVGVATADLSNAASGNGLGAEVIARSISKGIGKTISTALKPITKTVLHELAPDVESWLACE